MVEQHPLKDIVQRQKKGEAAGVCSICSAHPYVIEAAIEKGVADGSLVLIEATANQVNQFGGYTGMQPSAFAQLVRSVARKKGLPLEQLILGGDHLGPLVWQKETETAAMQKAGELIRQYILAGFSKIHLDTSMHLGSDDRRTRLPACLVAARAAHLAAIAERAWRETVEAGHPASVRPVYVIGSEVPVPGGAQAAETMQITAAADLQETLACFRRAFQDAGLQAALEQVIAVVVQPGVEFGDQSIHAYRQAAARELTACMRRQPGLVLEGHSTDYQQTGHLREMVADGIAILKVGPALTFALREGLIALEHIEQALYGGRPDLELSGFTEVLDRAMIGNPVWWERYYHGGKEDQALARLFSLSDRCRYYLGEPAVAAAISRLVANLRLGDVPLPLLSQYLPEQYWQVRAGLLANDAEALLKSKVAGEIGRYPAFRQNKAL